MKMRVCFALSVLVLTICALGLPAQAQDSKINLFGGYSYGTNNFGCGFGGFGCLDPGLQGYSGAVSYNFNKYIGLEANFSGHNGTSTIYYTPATSTANGENYAVNQDLYTYTFGPKLSLPVGKFSLFTHFLVGASHVHEGESDKCIQSSGSESSCFTSSSAKGGANGMAFKTGGGVDWNHGRWGVRILEVDYVHSQISGTITCTGCNAPETSDSSWNGFELATGVTFNFDKK
jgi:hypothetical protein